MWSILDQNFVVSSQIKNRDNGDLVLGVLSKFSQNISLEILISNFSSHSKQKLTTGIVFLGKKLPKMAKILDIFEKLYVDQSNRGNFMTSHIAANRNIKYTRV